MHIITAASKTENRISQRAARGKNNARAVSANLRAPDEAARSVFTRSWGEMFQTQTASHSFSLSLSPSYHKPAAHASICSLAPALTRLTSAVMKK